MKMGTPSELMNTPYYDTFIIFGFVKKEKPKKQAI